MIFDQQLIERLLFTFGVVIVFEFIRIFGEGIINTARGKINNNRAKTVGSLLKNALKFVLWIVAGSMILSRWGVDIAPIIAGAGIVGIAVGFGAQSLVRDVITGIFVIAEDYINVGDDVEVAGKRGIVKSVKLRTVVLRDEAGGQTHIIPNSAIGIITKFAKK